jgi:CHAT domain-containing protein
VSSLWTVDDKSSLYLMRRLYRRIADGKTFGAALAEAKRDMIRDFGPNAVPSSGRRSHWKDSGRAASPARV